MKLVSVDISSCVAYIFRKVGIRNCKAKLHTQNVKHRSLVAPRSQCFIPPHFSYPLVHAKLLFRFLQSIFCTELYTKSCQYFRASFDIFVNVLYIFITYIYIHTLHIYTLRVNSYTWRTLRGKPRCCVSFILILEIGKQQRTHENVQWETLNLQVDG